MPSVNAASLDLVEHDAAREVAEIAAVLLRGGIVGVAFGERDEVLPRADAAQEIVRARAGGAVGIGAGVRRADQDVPRTHLFGRRVVVEVLAVPALDVRTRQRDVDGLEAAGTRAG